MQSCIKRPRVTLRKCILLQADGEDELKKRQLMELAIINGTYRDSSAKAAAAAAGKHSRRLICFRLPFPFQRKYVIVRFCVVFSSHVFKIFHLKFKTRLCKVRVTNISICFQVINTMHVD